MSIAIGNKTSANATPASNSQSLPHNHNVGTGGTLLVVLTMASTANFTGTATYGGVSMTLVRNQLFSGLSQRQAIFVLETPPTGGNTVVVNFTGSQFNSTSLYVQSFTGANGYGVEDVNGASNSPNSKVLNIQQNSVIYTTGISDNTQSFGYEIAGSTRVNEFSHNTNKQVEGALSAIGLPSGNTDVITKADFGSITNYRIEIREAGSTPTPINTGNFFQMF